MISTRKGEYGGGSKEYKKIEAVKEAADKHMEENEARMSKIADSVFNQKHHQMMVVKDGERPDSRSCSFHYSKGTSGAHRQTLVLHPGNEAQKLIAEKGTSLDPQGR